MLHGRRLFVIPILAILAVFAVLAVTVISSNKTHANTPGYACQKMGNANTSRFYMCFITANITGPADTLEFDVIAPDKSRVLINKVTAATNPKAVPPLTLPTGWEAGIGGTKLAPRHGYSKKLYGDCDPTHLDDNHVSVRRQAGAVPAQIVKNDTFAINLFVCPFQFAPSGSSPTPNTGIKNLVATNVRWQLGVAPVPTQNGSGPGVVPTKTPKPNPTGKLSGVTDIVVPSGAYPEADKRNGLFHCIASTTHDIAGPPTAQAIKTSATCFADASIGDPNSALNGIGPPGTGGDLLPGPPPPPPFGTGAPAKGRGTYNSVTDHLLTTTCFTNVGGDLGPNIIAIVEVEQAVSQLQLNGKQQGGLTIYRNQSNKQCRDLTPSGTTYPFPLPIRLNIKLHPADKDNPQCNPPKVATPRCNRVPWRIAHAPPGPIDGAGTDDTDYDGDGCTDAQELSKSGKNKCGGSPWNPYDSGAASTDLNGAWYLLVTARPADSCFANMSDTDPALYSCAGALNGTFVPGAYYHCYAYITQVVKALTGDVLCYIDFGPATLLGPGTPLNVNTQQCGTCSGDGKAGAAPPGMTKPPLGGPNPILFADIPGAVDCVNPNPGVGCDTPKHTHLTGQIDNVKNTFKLSGCFADIDKFSPLGWVYVNVILDLHTRQGKVDIWSFQSRANCLAGTPAGVALALPVEGAKESGDPLWDTDQDGCPDAKELGDSPAMGGLRDPSNPWDYFNPSNNSTNRTKDITAVVNHFGHDALPPGDPLYNVKYDRNGQIPGGNKWNLLPPNGTIRAADITTAVNSFGNDCGVANPKPTPTPTVNKPITPTPIKPPTPTAGPPPP